MRNEELMRNYFALLTIVFLGSCSFLMTGPKLREINNKYYNIPSSIVTGCKLRFDGIYVSESSEVGVYYLLRFFKDGRMSNGVSPLEELRFDSSKGIANDGMSFYWTDCDSIKYHQQTHYGYGEFGYGQIEANGNILVSCEIYTHDRFLMNATRRFRFVKFSK